jgi:hypothetical protein
MGLDARAECEGAAGCDGVPTDVEAGGAVAAWLESSRGRFTAGEGGAFDGSAVTLATACALAGGVEVGEVSVRLELVDAAAEPLTTTGF